LQYRVVAEGFFHGLGKFPGISRRQFFIVLTFCSAFDNLGDLLKIGFFLPLRAFFNELANCFGRPLIVGLIGIDFRGVLQSLTEKILSLNGLHSIHQIRILLM
jgi:hypothetical protein